MGTEETTPTPATNAPTGHPKGFWFIFWGEFAERCSFYGMRAILFNYMAKEYGFGADSALVYMSLFLAAVYFLPLVGGYLGDRYGKYRTIVALCGPYILGHVIIGFQHPLALMVSLGLLAMGSGVTKPNISTLMGMTYDQQRPGLELLRTQAFAWFYVAINIGAAISQFGVPKIRSEFGYHVAFLFPAVLMAVAFIVFAIGKRHYAVESFEPVVLTPEQKAQRWVVLTRLVGVFGMVVFFWAIFDQSTSTWIAYAGTHMNCKVFGFEMDPEQFQALNPVIIVIGLPILTYLFAVLARRGIKVRATDKMFLGFMLTAVSMGLMTFAAYLAGPGETVTKIVEGVPVTDRVPLPPEERVTVWWQIGCYLAITVAEMLISVTGLELAFVVAPKTMKSFVTSLWLLVVAVANFGVNMPIGLLKLYTRMDPISYFGLLTVISVVVAVGFVVVARRFNRVATLAADPATAVESGTHAPG